MGYEVLSGLAIAPGEPAAERADYKQVFLFDRLRTKLEDLNPKIPLEGFQEALRKIRLISHPTLIENNRAFHRLLVEGVDVEEVNDSAVKVLGEAMLKDIARELVAHVRKSVTIDWTLRESAQWNRFRAPSG